MKRVPAFIFALAVAPALAPTAPLLAAPATGDPVEIPAVLTITGLAAFVGAEQSQAIALVEAYVNKNGGINGRPVKFRIYDEQSNPTIAVQIVNQAVASSKVPVMLGPVMQASCNATTSLVKSGPVSFCLSPADYPDSGSYRFNASAGVDDSAVMMVRYLRLRGLKRIALITATDAAGQVLDKSFAAAFAAPENKDAILTVHEHFNYADLSVAAQMARVKASNPQALIAWATGTPLATLLQAFRNAGLEIPFVGNSLVYEQALQLKSLMPKEFLFPGGPQALLTADLAALNSRDPVRRMQGVWGESFKAINVKPDFAQILVWDAAMLSVEILRRVGPNATPQQAHDYITNLHGWAGVNGVYDFRGRQRGVGAESIAMNRWDNEKDQIVAVSLGGGRPLK